MEDETKPTRFIKPEEIAADLEISRAAAYRLAAKIPAVRLDRTIRIERSDYESWLQAQKRTGGAR
jgi:predicted DNA-binding transcriptional regulator AlpA